MLPGLTRTLLMTGAVARKVIFLTAGATWTVPGDWTPTNNKIELIGGGGGGAWSNSGGTLKAGAGGGAAYAALANVALTRGAVLNMQIGAGGAGANAGNSHVSTDGTDTWLRIDGGSTAPTTTAQGALAKAGLKGITDTSGAGGLASASVGTIKNDGGAGGGGSSYVSGAGGGAAGGPHGPGAIGGNMTNAGNVGCGGGGGANGGQPGGNGTSTVGGDGGKNRLGLGNGAGQTSTINSAAGSNGGGGGGGVLSGAVNPGQGRDGSQDGIWTQTSNSAAAGPGAGGGGGVGSTYIGGNGGLYGGGGGGAGFSGAGTGTAGDGARGIIVITYGGAPLGSSPAAPVVQTTATGFDTATAATRIATLPTGIQPGDTLLLFANAISTTVPSVPGWTQIAAATGFPARLAILWRLADGTEGSSITITTAPTNIAIAWQIYRVSGAVAAAPQLGADTGAAGTNPDPPPLIISPQQPDGADNVLWIAAEAHAQAAVTTAGPAGFTGFMNTQTTGASRGVSSATLSSRAVSVDPGVFTNGGATGWNAQTLAVVAR